MIKARENLTVSDFTNFYESKLGKVDEMIDVDLNCFCMLGM